MLLLIPVNFLSYNSIKIIYACIIDMYKRNKSGGYTLLVGQLPRIHKTEFSTIKAEIGWCHFCDLRILE